MYVGVKLVNYPHLYYFSHFTHFTLYLRESVRNSRYYLTLY